MGAKRAAAAGLPISVTPYYLSLCDPGDSDCPIRRQCIPRAEEAIAVGAKTGLRVMILSGSS